MLPPTGLGRRPHTTPPPQIPSDWLRKYPAGRRLLAKCGLTEDDGEEEEEDEEVEELWLPWRCCELWWEAG